MTTFAEAVAKKQEQGLNPALWSGRSLKPEVRRHLWAIAHSFIEGLGTYAVDPKDIVVTGSNANFNWNSSSDIDLHILADLSQVDCDLDLAREFYHSQSFSWNEHHDIKLNGVPVEIYVQDVTEPHHASGVYSVQRGKWIREPKYIEFPPAKYVALKAKPLMKKINDLLSQAGQLPPEEMFQRIHAVRSRIRIMRKSGLAKGGEAALENLIFKHLRNVGYLDRLRDAGRKAYDRAMSLGESRLASEISMAVQEIGTWE